MTDDKIALITRTWFETKKSNDNDEKKDEYKNKLEDFFNKISESLDSIIVLINKEKETDNHTENLLKKILNKGEKYCTIDVKTYGVASGALNIGLNKIFTKKKKKPKHILIASKEVDVNKTHINEMVRYLKEPEMLVIGLALKAKLDDLLELERGGFIP